MDYYATQKRVEVRDRLADNPRIHVHFTPTSGSWMNLLEVWFGIIERQAIHRGTFGSVKDLNARIRAFIDGRRRDPQEGEPVPNLRNGPPSQYALS